MNTSNWRTFDDIESGDIVRVTVTGKVTYANSLCDPNGKIIRAPVSGGYVYLADADKVEKVEAFEKGQVYIDNRGTHYLYLGPDAILPWKNFDGEPHSFDYPYRPLWKMISEGK